MKELKILAVGNSFTEDAFYYLHDIFEASGINCLAVNLYIGGCSLKRHWENIETGERVYEYQKNGKTEGKYVSSEEVLNAEKWDYILTQQASHDSGMWETYEPWLEKVIGFFRQECPTAEILLQKTWAYETDSTHEAFSRYHNSQYEMYERLSECYEKAVEKIKARLIPSADVIQKVREEKGFRYSEGEKSLCRDGFHMDMIYGRYLVAALIFSFVTGKDIRKNSFIPNGAQKELVETIQRTIIDALK